MLEIGDPVLNWSGVAVPMIRAAAALNRAVTSPPYGLVATLAVTDVALVASNRTLVVRVLPPALRTGITAAFWAAVTPH